MDHGGVPHIRWSVRALWRQPDLGASARRLRVKSFLIGTGARGLDAARMLNNWFGVANEAPAGVFLIR